MCKKYCEQASKSKLHVVLSILGFWFFEVPHLNFTFFNQESMLYIGIVCCRIDKIKELILSFPMVPWLPSRSNFWPQKRKNRSATAWGMALNFFQQIQTEFTNHPTASPQMVWNSSPHTKKGFCPYGVSPSTGDQPWGLQIYHFCVWLASLLQPPKLSLSRLFIIACHN